MAMFTNMKKNNLTCYLTNNNFGRSEVRRKCVKVVTVTTVYRPHSSAVNYLKQVQSAMLEMHGLIKYQDVNCI